MRVVSNTSPLSYLVLIDCAEVLPQLFGTVVIPAAVRDELLHPDSPARLRDWMDEMPAWLAVERLEPGPEAAELSRLHAGEREAILLAEQLAADLILLDEKLARTLAAARGLRVSGLLGVLDEAGRRGLVDVSTAIDRLRQTTFRVSPRLLTWLANRHRSQ